MGNLKKSELSNVSGGISSEKDNLQPKPTRKNDYKGWKLWWEQHKLQSFPQAIGPCVRCNGKNDVIGGLCKKCQREIETK